MCDNHNFLDDDLSDLFGSSEPVSDERADMVFDHLSRHKAADQVPPACGQQEYKEKCPKCNGSGQFRSYTGRVVGNCFKCKGAGELVFKTSPEARAKSAEQREAVKERRQKERAAAFNAWIEEHKDEFEWLVKRAPTFEFAKSLFESLAARGSLSDKQLAAVRRCLAQDHERERERQEIANRAPDIEAAALDKIMLAFHEALDRSIKYPKLRLDAFVFSFVRSGQNAGSLYVKSAETDENGERRYYGKITDGRFFRGFKCSEEDEKRIIEAASDPEAAAIAYGRREGRCSVCNRTLTKHDSIDRGIGPICAERFGW
ncbi:hypothetical protein [Erythrobacter phage vB_EliS-L02]|nr:hypothetical protein [Erythrobacter phage vB_EliS-L02]